MSLRPRATAALLLAALAGSLIAAPASAAGAVRWVDDDGHRGATGCDGSKTAFAEIQGAIDASGPGDIVKVCPGTYKNEVSIETLELRVESTKRGAAVITHPLLMTAAAPAGDPTLVTITGEGVTFTGFKVKLGVEPDCVIYNGILVLNGKHVTVSKNTVVGRADDATVNCGLGRGITYATGATGLATKNTVMNWNESGIAAEIGSNVRIVENRLTWTKTVPAPTSRRSTPRAVMPAGAPSGPAILANQARARVVGNTVVRVKGAALPQSNGGIVFTSASGRINGNTITRFAYGITVGYDGSEGEILGNTLTRGRFKGIILYDLPVVLGADPETDPVWTVHGNTVHGFGQVGIELANATRNHVDHNTVTQNGTVDCKDSDPEENAWHWNKGADSDPSGLCTTPAKR